MAKAILALGLSTEEKQRLQGYGDELQGKLVEESSDAAKFILEPSQLGRRVHPDLTRFYSYNSRNKQSRSFGHSVETAEPNIVQKILYHALSAKDIVEMLVFMLHPSSDEPLFGGTYHAPRAVYCLWL